MLWTYPTRVPAILELWIAAALVGVVERKALPAGLVIGLLQREPVATVVLFGLVGRKALPSGSVIVPLGWEIVAAGLVIESRKRTKCSNITTGTNRKELRSRSFSHSISRSRTSCSNFGIRLSSWWHDSILGLQRIAKCLLQKGYSKGKGNEHSETSDEWV